ncbi:MAG: LUD domain-containing protein [Verrucomicrobiota bacterium]
MSDRANILARIREALTLSAPVPGGHHLVPTGKAPIAKPHGQIRDWLPAVGPTQEQQIELFRANSADLKSDFRLLDSLEAVAAELRAIAASEGWKKIATHCGELTSAVCTPLGLPTLDTTGGYDAKELEKCDAGISLCDALIAQTGSVLVTSRTSGGRALSVLPPHHVVIARREQLLADLPAAFALLKEKYGSNYPSMISFITGPSRTGDIERILVLGAHGPKKLTILVF